MMPKLPDSHFRVRYSHEGETYNFKSETFVSVNGIFSIQIPKEMVDAARDLKEKDAAKYIGDSVREHPGKARWVVESKSLDRARALVEMAAAEYMRAVEEVEYVVAYKMVGSIHYYKSADGAVLPNGNFVNNYEKDLNLGGRWAGNKDNDPFGTKYGHMVGLVAGVYMKRIQTRRTGKTIVYSSWYGNDPDGTPATHHGTQSWAQKLNQFGKQADSSLMAIMRFLTPRKQPNSFMTRSSAFVSSTIA